MRRSQRSAQPRVVLGYIRVSTAEQAQHGVSLTRDEASHRVVGEPKTRKSRRRIDLGPLVVALLRKHKPNDARGDDFVFVTEANTPIDRANFRRRHYTPLLKAAKLKPIRFHDLRHTAATLMLANGTHPKVVQERLGHASIAITLDTYSHAVPGMQRAAADALDTLLQSA